MEAEAVAGRSPEGWAVARLPPEWFGGGGAGYAWDGIDLAEEAAGDDGLAHIRVGGGVVVTIPAARAPQRRYLCSAWPSQELRAHPDPDAPCMVDCCVTADPLDVDAAGTPPPALANPEDKSAPFAVEIEPLDKLPAPAVSVTLANHPSTPHDAVLRLGRHASCAMLSAVFTGAVLSTKSGVYAPSLGGWFTVASTNPATSASPYRLITHRTIFHINLSAPPPRVPAPLSAASADAAARGCPMPGLEEAWAKIDGVARAGGGEGVLLHGAPGLGKRSLVKAWGAARNKAHVLALDCRRTTAAALRDAAVRVRALREAAVAAAPASARPDGSVVVLLEHIDGVEGGKDVLRYDDVQRLAAAVALIEAVTGADTVAQHTYVDPASADAATPQVPVAEPKPKPAAQPAKPFSFSAPSVSASTTAGGSRSTSTASAAKPKRVHHGRWGAVVVATAASLSGIPMVLRRSGRLGFESYATPPDEGTRARIFATFGMGTAAAAAAAELTPGCAGADLRAIYDAAGTDNASLDDIRAACTAHRASLQRGACTQLTGHTSFDAVGGLHDVKEALDRLVLWPMRNPETCARFNVRPPKGLLLYGPPGTGKTLLVRALASACKRSLLSLDAAALFACYVGESEAILRAAFAKARLLAPSFLFIDEVESVCGRERQGGGGSVDVATGVLTTLLNELDGVDTGGADVIFLAATNHPEALDSAILRPGRIDRLLHIPQPEPPQRLDILRLYTKGLPLSPAAEAYLSLFAEVPTEGFTGADIKAFVSEASYAALRRHLGEGDGGGGAGVGDVEIDKDDFVEAMRRVMPSVTPAVARRFSEFAATVSVQ